MEKFLQPRKYINSDHPKVIAFAKENTHSKDSKKENAVNLYYAVRDGFTYNPHHVDLSEYGLKASTLLTRDSGYCVEKACLLAACARVVGIPSRLQFANVINHIATEKIEVKLKTNKLVFHGYTELFIQGKWVKATPSFNKELCVLLGVEPLEFDGEMDSIFQQYSSDGKKFMEYKHAYGFFADVPRDLFISELKKYYPHLFKKQWKSDNELEFKL